MKRRPNRRRRRSRLPLLAFGVLAVLLVALGAKAVAGLVTGTSGTTAAVEEVETETVEDAEEEPEQWSVWSDEALALQEELDAAVAAIEANGYEVGYIAIDGESGETVEYNADTVFYGASSIKGPYVVSLVQELGSAAVQSYSETIEDCLSWSSNSAYVSLREAYASYTFFDELVEEAGATLEEADNYAFYSPRTLALLWLTLADYLTSEDENAQWLGTLLADSLYSTVDDCASEDDTTFSKAGWYYGGAEEYDTTADGGLVVFEAGTFAVAVMTSDPYDFEALSSVMAPLVALCEELYLDE